MIRFTRYAAPFILLALLLAWFSTAYASDLSLTEQAVDGKWDGGGWLSEGEGHTSRASRFLASCGDDEINFAPSAPTTNDAIQIIPSGTWCNGCVPGYESHQITGDVIRIDAETFQGICTQALTGWKFTVEAGSLSAGSYTAQVYVNGLFHQSRSLSVADALIGTPTITPTPTPPSGSLPDLTISYMGVTLETGHACNFSSTGLGVRVWFKNQGSADAGPFVVEVNGVQQSVTSGLSAGETSSLWFAGYASGENSAFVDVTSQVTESDENNNQLSQMLPIPTLPPTCTPTPTGTITATPSGGSQPDLTVTYMQVTLETGGACNYSSTNLGVRVWFKNQGSADAGPFVVEVNGVQQSVTSGLSAGETGSLWFAGHAFGFGEDSAFVDATLQVTESDENNNQLSQVLPIPTLPPTCTPTPTGTITPTPTPTPTPSPPSGSLPDLTISGMGVTLETGGACNFSSTNLGVRVWFKNQGSADAGPFVVEVNGVQQSVTSGLSAGETASLWFAGYASGENSAFVDAILQVTESDENNNQLSQMLPIPTLPPTCTPTPTGTITPTPTGTPTPSNPSTITITINIQAGWNFIALPIEPVTPYTAESACDEINQQGGSVVEIDRWLNGGWDGHICNLPFNDFDLDLVTGFFLRANQASTWTIEGYERHSVELEIQAGWNSISLPFGGYTAESLCDVIINQGVTIVEIDRWHNGGWDGHLCNLPFNDFPIQPGKSYFLKATSSGTVTIPGP